MRQPLVDPEQCDGDPEFGYRFITDEPAGKGVVASCNRLNRLCSQQRLRSVQSRKRGTGRKPSPPVHDDLGCAASHRAPAESAVADRHPRAPDRRGKALPVRGQRGLLQADRRLLDRQLDDRQADRQRAPQRPRAPRQDRRHRPLRPGQPAWVQLVDATPGGAVDSSSFRTSAGVLQSRVFLGRLFRLEATAASSSLSTGSGRCPWGSTDAAARWCSRSCRAARGCEGRRRRSVIQSGCGVQRAGPFPILGPR